ncbi:hypothetical protein QTP88_010890 [Uroleucon formosanum]
MAFLNQRCLTIESIETRSNSGKIALPTPYATNTKQLAQKNRSYTTTFAVTDRLASSCTLCSGQHAMYACQRFLGMTVSEHREHVRSKRLCYNCLHPEYMSRICSRNLTLLHIIASTEVQVATAADAIESQQKQLQQIAVFLSTAIVLVSSPWGSTHSARLLFDFGSQCHFITSGLVKRLGSQGRNSSTSIIRITQSNCQSTRSVLWQIKSRKWGNANWRGNLLPIDSAWSGQTRIKSTIFDQTIQKFWELEEVNPVHKLTGIESRCEETYKNYRRQALHSATSDPERQFAVAQPTPALATPQEILGFKPRP